MSIDAERCLLGALFISTSQLQEVLAEVEERDFSLIPHRTIYRRICDLHADGISVDIITLSTRLTENGELENVGGAALLAELCCCVPTAANIMHYARIVSMSGKRSRLENSLKSSYTRLKQGEDLQAIAETLKESSVNAMRPPDDAVKLEDILPETMKNLEALCRGEKTETIKTGFFGIDTIAGGFEPGQVIIIAARPSIGKTIFADQIAAQIPVNVFSFCLEMTAEQMARRRLISKAGVSIAEARNSSGLEKLTRAANDISAEYYQTFYNDRFFDITKIIGAIHAEHRRKKIGAVVIDYLQLLRGKGRTRNEEIGYIARALKELALELNLVMILVSQLSRLNAKEKRTPQLSDLRDSGEIEQAADIVIMLHSDLDKENKLSEDTEAFIRKYRNGYLKKFDLRRQGALYRFIEVDKRYEVQDWNETEH